MLTNSCCTDPDTADSSDNPLPLEYTKRRAASYPVLFFGPKGEQRVPQDLLANRKIPDIETILSATEIAAWGSGRPIVKCPPTSKTTLPGGGPTIGISDEYQIAVGKKMPYAPGKTEGGGKINQALRPYGYRAGAEAYDGDHVIEMQIGGPNILDNLWPLDKGENRSSGAKLAATRVKPESAEMSLEEAYKKRGGQLWLIIVKTL